MALESFDNEISKTFFLSRFVCNRIVRIVCRILSSLAIGQISEKRA